MQEVLLIQILQNRVMSNKRFQLLFVYRLLLFYHLLRKQMQEVRKLRIKVVLK